jgi:hypothetical protein
VIISRLHALLRLHRDEREEMHGAFTQNSRYDEEMLRPSVAAAIVELWQDARIPGNFQFIMG